MFKKLIHDNYEIILKEYKDLSKEQKLKLKEIDLEINTNQLNTKKLTRTVLSKLQIILINEFVIGFFAPEMEYDDFYGYYRVEPLKITNNWKNKGISFVVLSNFYKDKNGLAYIYTENINSIKLFTKLGFLETDLLIDKFNFGKWYIKKIN